MLLSLAIYIIILLLLLLKYIWLELLIYRQKFSSELEIFPHVCLEEWPLWMCVIHSTKNWYQENPMLRTGPWWPKKCFQSTYQNFLIRTMNHPPFGSFISLRPFWWEATRFIISCTLYPFYSWKVYMENKNYMCSFHPTGSPQDSEARNKKNKLIKEDFLDLRKYAERRPI